MSALRNIAAGLSFGTMISSGVTLIGGHPLGLGNGVQMVICAVLLALAWALDLTAEIRS